MKKEIEFVTGPVNAPSPTAPPKMEAKWQDITLTPAASRLRVKFAEGKNPIRLIPALPGGSNSYVEKLDVIKNDAFKAVAQPGDLFARALSWLWSNKKDAIYHYEKNKTGIKLKAQSEAVAWCIWWDTENKPRLGLMQSAFSTGKSPGLLADIVSAAEATEAQPGSDETVRVYDHSVADQLHGRIITIEKTVDKSVEARFGTSYKATISSKEAGDIMTLINQLSDEERDLLCPLDKLIRVPTEDEQRALLSGYLGATFREMGI